MKSKSPLFCLIRQTWVTETPEEKVRQKLLAYMIQELGYPRAYLAVEKELKLMPHLVHSSLEVPNRRADIICFGKNLHHQYPLFPFLMIECKAVPLTAKVLQQVVGYNHCVQARYIAIANQHEIRTGQLQASGEYTFTEHLPFYH